MSEARRVHPVAALFPMHSEDELRRMAEDIAEQGLVRPITLDADGEVLLDRRNRLAACEIAGVEPVFEKYQGDDPARFILAANGYLRELSKGQLAIIAAQSCDSQHRGEAAAAAKAIGVDNAMMSKALLIVEHGDPDGVLAGKPFDEAYRRAMQSRDNKRDEADRTSALPADLATLVKSGLRTLPDAENESANRQTVERVDERIAADGGDQYAPRVAAGALTWSEAARLAKEWDADRADSLGRDRSRLLQVIGGWPSLELVAAKDSSAYVDDLVKGLTSADRQALDAILTRLEPLHGEDSAAPDTG